MGAVFDALGSATRRRILDIVKGEPGCSVGDVASHFDTSRIAVMRHLQVLEAAGLLLSRRDGRRRRLYHNAVPIQLIYDRWTNEYPALWSGRMADVKYRVESRGSGVTTSRSKKGKKNGGASDVRVARADPGSDRGRVA
jgi:DNA-binding transcriptional ArsR family regulator